MDENECNVEVGMMADDVLLLPGRAKAEASNPPKIVGSNAKGLIVEWYYKDCTVVLKHTGKFYAVAEVKPPATAKPRGKKRNGKRSPRKS